MIVDYDIYSGGNVSLRFYLTESIRLMASSREAAKLFENVLVGSSINSIIINNIKIRPLLGYA